MFFIIVNMQIFADQVETNALSSYQMFYILFSQCCMHVSFCSVLMVKLDLNGIQIWEWMPGDLVQSTENKKGWEIVNTTRNSQMPCK